MQSPDSRSISPDPEQNTLLRPLHSSVQDVASTMPSNKSKAEDQRQMSDIIGLGLAFGGSGLVVLITFVLVLIGSSARYGWFTFHPLLQSVSIASLILGIIPLQPSPKDSKDRSKNFDTHQKILLRLTSPLMLLGTGAIWWNKYLRSAEHFTTWHGLFGAVSVSWMESRLPPTRRELTGQIIQGVMGVGMAWYGPQLFGSERDAKRIYKYHRLSGYILVLFVLGTAYLGGAQSMWGRRLEGVYSIIGFISYWIGLPAIGLGLFMRMRTSKMQFTKVILELYRP